MDPMDFVGQNVLILGRGNSAFETAENIFDVTNFIHMLSRSRVRLSWATHYVGDLRYATQLLVCSVLPAPSKAFPDPHWTSHPFVRVSLHPVQTPFSPLAFPLAPRAINNGLLDTYQLKSLDGLLESDLTNLALVKDREGRFHVTLKYLLEETNQTADAITLPQDDNDNFAMRDAYDRVIRCLGWNFDFSIFNK